jgi:hypothetical protein
MGDCLSTMMDSEPCDAITPGYAYRIADPAKRVIDPRWGVAAVISCDGSPVSPTAYRIFHKSGTIIFRNALSTAATVTVDGAYLPPLYGAI